MGSCIHSVAKGCSFFSNAVLFNRVIIIQGCLCSYLNNLLQICVLTGDMEWLQFFGIRHKNDAFFAVLAIQVNIYIYLIRTNVIKVLYVDNSIGTHNTTIIILFMCFSQTHCPSVLKSSTYSAFINICGGKYGPL